MIFKAAIIGLLIAFGEIVNGNIRVRILHKKFGKKRAKTISFFSGITIIFSISWFMMPWIMPNNYHDCFFVGSIWLVLMIGLDICFGKFVFNLKWNKIIDDFNPIKGNLLGVGMLFLFLCPVIVFWLQK